ncbi:hypothetical protein, partial [Mesomycoplasma ovipneumoniae]|uniref:hypothetical protein n=1 Tax=Mesomycoplasma ovipneumoniae TaxID=29562 RepID=UPI003080735E
MGVFIFESKLHFPSYITSNIRRARRGMSFRQKKFGLAGLLKEKFKGNWWIFLLISIRKKVKKFCSFSFFMIQYSYQGRITNFIRP